MDSHDRDATSQDHFFHTAFLLGEFLNPCFRLRAMSVAVLESLIVLIGCAAPLVHRRLIDGANAGDSRQVIRGVIELGLVLSSSLAGRVAVRWLRSQLGIELRWRLKSAMFQRLLNLPENFLRDKGTGYFFNRLQADIGETAAFLIGHGLSFMANVLKIVAVMAIVGYLQFYCLLWLLPFLIVQLLICRRFRHVQYRLSHRIQECVAVERHVMQEYLAMHATLKTHSATTAAQQRIHSGFSRWKKLMRLRNINENEFQLFLQFPVWICCGCLSIYGLQQVLEKAWTLGELWALLGLLMMVFTPARTLGNALFQMQTAQVCWQRLRGLYQQQSDIPDNDVVQKQHLHGDIVLSNVSFAYCSHQPVLENLTLKVKDRSLLFLTGENGSGKSSLLLLLLRLYQPQQGDIAIGGVPITHLPLELYRSKIGYLGQTPEFFHGTLRENLTLGHAYSDEAIMKLAHLLNCEELIKRDPLGLDSLVREKGSNFSGGEKLHLALIRELLRDTDILLLDEAAANLDDGARRRFYALLPQLQGRQTVIAVVHDLPEIAAQFPVVRLPERKK